ncbi:MAG: type VI secretion system baseplate subunit TssG [Planctomycetaceae bacterium]|nr:type VI secretion system baseplate subunit TssG [Planctomycetaceae bacterium]
MTEPIAKPAPDDAARPIDDRLATKLMREPYRFDFFQAVRVLSRLRPQRRAVGVDAAPRDEVCRFRSHATHAFPASQIQEYREPAKPDGPAELVVNFFGLVGPLGALPRAYTDAVIERRMRRRDRTLHDFLDLFSHRLTSMFVRAWEKYRGWTGYEAAARLERRRGAEGEIAKRAFVLTERAEHDRVSQALLELAGVGDPALRYRVRERDRLTPRAAIRDETLRFFSGLLAQRHRSAAGLESMLAGQFDRRVRVRQLCGRWLVLEPDDVAKIGSPGRSELSTSLVVGSRVWDVQGKFRVEIGPLDFASFSECLPDGTAHRPLTDLTRLYSGTELDFDFELRLRPDEVPECRPGRNGPTRPQLGWTTWLRTVSPTEPAVVILRPKEAE